MNIRLITRTVGYVLWVEAGFLLLPLLLSICYSDGCSKVFVATIIICALLGGAGSVALCALLMGVACACMSGVEPLVTTLIPMEYDREGLIGLSAGLMDSLIYVGSALAGVTAGLIRESLGLNALFMGWAAAALLCALLSAGADGMLRRYRALSPADG